MEGFLIYLLKSFVWLTGFTLVYILFLRNERFFFLNRLYLLSGILVSFFFPLITIQYIVELPAVVTTQVDSPVTGTFQQSAKSFFPSFSLLILLLYLTGVLILFFRIIRQTISVYRVIKKVEYKNLGKAKLIRTTEFSSPFSFFSYIFVKPSITDIETEVIVNHEIAHIRQKHWFDLMLAELIFILQWINPFAWIYLRLIKQNHEYFADEVALRCSSNPAVYKAALLNQMFNSPVISLTNSFNYSLNKKRFDMMKNIIVSPYRKLKILFVLPVFAIVLYSFAKPEYRYTSLAVNVENQNLTSETAPKAGNKNDIQEYNKPLQDTTIKKSKDSETRYDESPKFNGGDPTVEFRKYIYENLKYPQIAKEKGISGRVIVQFVVNDQGKVTDANIAKSADPSLDKEVLRLVSSSPLWTPGYQKGKAVKIFYTFPVNFNLSGTLKEKSTSEVTFKEELVYDIAEIMPKFNDGDPAIEFRKFMFDNLIYPPEAVNKGLSGRVIVHFIVSSEGKVTNVKNLKSSNEIFNEEAINVVKASPLWTPGMQDGKAVAVSYTFPINFTVK